MIGAAAATAIAAVNNLFGIVDKLKPDDPKVLKQQVSDLLDNVLDVKKAVVKVTDENAELVRENAELKRQQSQAPELVFRDAMYWKMKPDGTPEGPFCPKCYNSNGKVVPLGEELNDYDKLEGYRCSVCKWTKHVNQTTNAPSAGW